MPPVSKSKSKRAARVAKEQSQVSPKSSSLHANGNNTPTSAYNPTFGTFETIEASASASAPSLTHKNAQLITPDETEEQLHSSPGTTTDCDSLSNSGSCSGESEDQKDKTTTSVAPHSESIPVTGSDAYKREKIRQKNERKHRRQKEKRAQELHARCCGYLMSRKLAALAQQLVAMGFPSDRSTMALVANEGRMEESVAWLLQEGEDTNEVAMPNPEEGGAQMKIDISDELATVTGWELKYKCSKQEVERAVVASEGDLSKAEDNLKAQKQELAADNAEQKVEEAGDPSRWDEKLRVTTGQSSTVRSQVSGGVSISDQQQHQMDGRDPNYPKVAAESMFQESMDSLQSLRRQQMPEWVRAHVAAAAAMEKIWPNTSTNRSVSHPLGFPHPFSSPSASSDSRYRIFSGEANTNLQTVAPREPFPMQHPKSIIGTKQNSSSGDIGAAPPQEWYFNEISGMDMMASNLHGIGLNGAAQPLNYSRGCLQSFGPNLLDSASFRQSGSRYSTGDSYVSCFESASSLVAPASLGLFSSWGSSLGSSSSVDWNSEGSAPQRDYSSIDWSLDLTQLRPTLKSDWQPSDSWAMMMGGRARARSIANIVYVPGLQESSSLVSRPPVSAPSREWTSPFAGNDLFGIPRRQFVSTHL